MDHIQKSFCAPGGSEVADNCFWYQLSAAAHFSSYGFYGGGVLIILYNAVDSILPIMTIFLISLGVALVAGVIGFFWALKSFKTPPGSELTASEIIRQTTRFQHEAIWQNFATYPFWLAKAGWNLVLELEWVRDSQILAAGIAFLFLEHGSPRVILRRRARRDKTCRLS